MTKQKLKWIEFGGDHLLFGDDPDWSIAEIHFWDAGMSLEVYHKDTTVFDSGDHEGEIKGIEMAKALAEAIVSAVVLTPPHPQG